MKATRFYAVIGEDRVIRLPQDVELHLGQAEVILLQQELSSQETPSVTASSWPLIDHLSRAAEKLGITDLPSDLAENHDHYLYGLTKGIDKQ